MNDNTAAGIPVIISAASKNHPTEPFEGVLECCVWVVPSPGSYLLLPTRHGRIRVDIAYADAVVVPEPIPLRVYCTAEQWALIMKGREDLGPLGARRSASRYVNRHEK